MSFKLSTCKIYKDDLSNYHITLTAKGTGWTKFYFNLQLIIPSDLLNIIFQQKMQYLLLYFEQNYANLLIKDYFCFYDKH